MIASVAKLITSKEPSEMVEELRKVIAGDPAAVRAFVQTYSPILLGQVRLVLSRWDKPSWGEEDLLQEALMDLLYRKKGVELGSWDPAKGRSLENYLRYFTHYRTIDRLLKGQRNRHDPTEDVKLHEKIEKSSSFAAGPDWLEPALLQYKESASKADWHFLERLVGGAEAKDLMAEFTLTRAAFDQRTLRLRRRLLAFKKELV